MHASSVVYRRRARRDTVESSIERTVLTLVSESPTAEIEELASPQTMAPPSSIPLFNEFVDQGQRPTSFVASVVVHAVAIAVVSFSVAYKPPVVKISTEHYSVRQLDLHVPIPQQQPDKKNVAYSDKHLSGPASAGKPTEHVPVLRLMTHAKTAPQTLVQPDVAINITLPQQIPVPQAMIWTPSKVVVKSVVPPTPAKPTSADVKPSVERPNQEINLADVNIASHNIALPKIQIVPSTTSPVAVHSPAPAQVPLMTVSQTAAQPTPASILSLSDLRMKDGTAVLPPVNESAAANSKGALEAGKPKEGPASTGVNNSAAKPGNGGTNPNAGGAANHPGPVGAGGKPETASADTDSLANSGDAARARTTPIALPKDGHFGAVIVNDSLDAQFPEVSGVWSGRLAYTAYLHVGLKKSWILQYSLPLSADPSAGGTAARLDAPWPYNIVRPNLTPGSIDADALMIHGFVDESGRLQNLSVVLPQAYAGTQFVLAALQQWQFRPATQNGQVAKVEVLLIIPDEVE